MLKAYIVSENRNYEKSKLVFAETANKAKQIANSDEDFDGVEYIELTARRAKYADGHENDSERDLIVLNIRNGWWYDIGEYHIDSDNLEQMIAEGIL